MKRRLLYFLLLLSVTFSILTLIYQSERKSNLVLLRASENDHLHSEQAYIEMVFRNITSDLDFLVNLRVLHVFLETNDTSYIHSIEEEFSRFTKAKKDFEQVRFLDISGMEIARVDMKDSIPYIIQRHKLQDKSQRYYFKDAIILPNSSIYVSPFDLNIERGEVEKPLNPMLRFAKPVFDENGKKRGIVIINYRGKDLLERIRFTERERQKIQTFMVNSSSYYLIGPSPLDEWGFMFTDRFHINMESQYPDEWNSIKSSRSGLILTEKGIFIHHSVYPLATSQQSSTGSADPRGSSIAEQDSTDYYWKLISFIPAEKGMSLHFNRFLKFYTIFFIFSLIVSHLLATLKEHHLRAKRETELAHKELERQNSKLQKAVDTKNTFFSIIAHDLRNPIQVVIGYTGMLIDNYEQMELEEVKEYFKDIETATTRLLKLLENLLDWSRSQTDTIPFKPKKLPVSTLVDTAFSAVQMNAGQKKIQLSHTITPQLTVYCDMNMITTVIRNLLTNSVKFTPQNGEITVLAYPHGSESVCIEIHDTGVGMSEEDAEKLFKVETKFSRQGTNGEAGTGLGLILSSEFIAKNHGSITVASTLGEGSTFKIILPRKMGTMHITASYEHDKK